MSEDNPTLEDFGFYSKELMIMIEVQRETAEKLIKAEAEISYLLDQNARLLMALSNIASSIGR